jgi:hypothetical protein
MRGRRVKCKKKIVLVVKYDARLLKKYIDISCATPVAEFVFPCPVRHSVL